MKKLLCFILAIMLLISFLGCQPQNNTPPKNEEKTTFPYPTADVEYKIYGDGFGVEPEENEEKPWIPELVYDFNDTDRYQKVADNHNAPGSIEVEIFGKAFLLGYVRTTISDFSLCEDERLRDEKYKNEYESADGKIRIEVDEKNGNILFFTDRRARVNNGDFTEAQAKEKAISVVEEMLGEGTLDGYFCFLTEKDDDRKEIEVMYQKSLHGYPVQDWVRVTFDLQGNVVVYNALQYGITDPVEYEITSERIKKAEHTLISSFPKGYYVDDGRNIIIDTNSGKCYLELYGRPKESKHGMVYYINIY